MQPDLNVDWAARPQGEEATPPQNLIRVNNTAPLKVIITSYELVGVNVHFWRGRTTPHLAGTCPACVDHNAYRWRGYLCVCNPQCQAVAACELTPPCVEALDLYNKQWGTIRGAQMTLSRPSGKPNGRIHCEVVPSRVPTNQLPEPFDLKRLLYKLWEVQVQTKQPTTRTVSLLQPDEGAA